MKTQSFQVYPLRGIDQRFSAEPNAAERIEDMTWSDQDGWEPSGGIRQIVPDISGSNYYDGNGKVASIHWFAQHNGARQWLLYEHDDGSLKYFAGSYFRFPAFIADQSVVDAAGNAFDGTIRARTVIDTPWQRTQSQTFGGRIYLVNGQDEPIVFNGRYADRAGFRAKPGAPNASVLPQEDLDGDGYPDQRWLIGGTDLGLGSLSADVQTTRRCGYRYRVSWVNERGQESEPSESSEMVVFDNGDGIDPSTPALPPVVNTGGRSITFVTLPRGDDSVVARRVYRTRNILDSNGEPVSLGFGDVFYFLTEIQDNVTESFEDMVPDSNLGSLFEPLNFGKWPTSAKFMALFKNTMFIAGMQTNQIFYSRVGNPEVFPQDNIIDIGDADMGPITGMYATKNSLVVFKNRGIYLIKGDPSNGLFAQTLNRDVGCVAPNSIAELPGLGVVFLATDGLFLLQGALENTGTATAVVRLSANIGHVFKRMNKSAAINAFGAVYHQDHEYWLTFPTIGDCDNNFVLVFHYDIGAWSTRENFPIACMLESRDHRGYLFIGSHDETNKPGVHVYSKGWPDKLNGDEILPVYQTTTLDFGSVYNSVTPKHVIVQGLSWGNNNLELNAFVNHQIDPAYPENKVIDQQDPNFRKPVYDTAVWGTDIWYEPTPIVMRFDISARHKGPVHELSLQFSAEPGRMTLIGYDIELATGEQRDIKPLVEALKPDKG